MVVFFPQELIDAVLDELYGDRTALAKCCLVSRSFLPRARANLWLDVNLTEASIRHLQHHPSLLPLIRSLYTQVYNHAAVAASASFIQDFPNIERFSWALSDAQPEFEPFLRSVCSAWKLKAISLTYVVANLPGDLCSFLRNFPSLQSLRIDEDGDPVRRVPCQCQDSGSASYHLPRVDDFRYRVYEKDTQLQKSLIAGGCVCSLQEVRSVLLEIGSPMSQLDALLATFANSMREFTLYGTVNALSWSNALPLSKLHTFTFRLDIEEKAENVLRWMTSQLLSIDMETCFLTKIIVELQLSFICRYEWEQITASVLEPWNYFIDVVRRIPSARALDIKLISYCWRGQYEDVMMRVRALGDYMQAYLSCIHVDGCPLRITLYSRVTTSEMHR